MEVFKGSTGDPDTVASQIAKLRERFGLSKIVLVGDRGMLTSARIREELGGRGGSGLDQRVDLQIHRQTGPEAGLSTGALR